MNYGIWLYLKLAMVDVGNVSKKGENMEGITRSIFTSWFFNGTLSIYITGIPYETGALLSLYYY